MPKILFKPDKEITKLNALIFQTSFEKKNIKKYILLKPPLAIKNQIKSIEALCDKVGWYYLISALLGTDKIGKQNKKKLLNTLEEYEKEFERYYKKIYEKEKKYCDKIQKKSKGRLLKLFRQADKYTKIKTDRKVFIIPVLFFYGGMSFHKGKNIFVLLPVIDRFRNDEDTFYLILHESLHPIGNLIKEKSMLAKKLEKKISLKKFKKLEIEEYGSVVNIINESFTRSIDYRLAVLNGRSEVEYIKNCKKFALTLEFYNALKNDYEKQKFIYKNIRNFGFKWIKKNLL